MATRTDQRLPPGAVVAVLDRERTMVARTRRDAETVGARLSAEVAAVMQAGTGMVPIAYTSLDGSPVIAAHAEAPLRAALFRTAAIGAGLLAASLLLGVALAGRLAVSIRQLADNAGGALVTGPPEPSALAGTLTSPAARYGQMVVDLRALFDGSPVGVLRCDAGGQVRDANDASPGIVGMTRADLAAGRVRWDDLTPPEWIGRDEAAIAEAARLGGCPPYRKEYVRPDGNRVSVLVFFAFTDAATGAAAILVVDLSRWVSTEPALARVHEQMRLAIGAARMFFWDWNITTGAVEWSGGLEAACGLPPGGFGGTVATFRALMHPDDFPQVAAALGHSLAGEASYDTEFRMYRPDGSLRWVVARGTVQRDGTGRPVRIDVDVTGRKVAEAALIESEAQLRRVQRIGRVGGFEFDLRGGARVRGHGYRELHGLRAAAEASDGHREWLARLHPEDRERAERCLLAAVSDATAAATYAQEYRIFTADGSPHRIAVRGEIERDAEGRGQRLLGAHVGVNDIKRAEQALAASEARLLLVAQEAGGIGFSDYVSPVA